MKAITRRCAALIVGISLCVSASAAPGEAQDEARIQACLVQAAAAFQVEVLPLKLLRQVEAGTLGRVSGNTNGSYDIGPMQINSTWLPRLARVGITEEMVRDDARRMVRVRIACFPCRPWPHGFATCCRV